jgi:serpin B
MLTRRDSLRLLGLAALAGSPLVAACANQARHPTSTGHIRLVGADVPRAAGDSAAIPEVVTGVGDFTGDVWGLLAKPVDNLAISPFSIAVALAMTANGAVGRTQSQMLDVLHIQSLPTFNDGLDALTRGLAALAGPVTLSDGSKGQIDLTIADQLFGDHSVTWQQAFLATLARQYGASMRTVDFRDDPEAASALINDWTSTQTHDRIPQILPAGVVDSSTRLVLVNALYFKAPWSTPFVKESTTRSTFTRADGSTVTVDLMNGDPNGDIRYVQGGHYQGARLPYSGGSLAMTVALPDPGREDDVLRELMTGGLGNRGQAQLALSLPRWTFRTPSNLVPPLEQLGMTQAFSTGADFSGMTTTARLDISFLLHQAFVSVDEDGTEAAAATAVGMQTSAVQETRKLVIDRPFLFVIHDTAHGTPLFVGRVADPTASS